MENSHKIMLCCFEIVSLKDELNLLNDFSLSLGYNPCDYMQSMSEFSQVWLDYIHDKVPIESVLEEIGNSGYDVTQGTCKYKLCNKLM